jgi:hypothetical protein
MLRQAILKSIFYQFSLTKRIVTIQYDSPPSAEKQYFFESILKRFSQGENLFRMLSKKFLSPSEARRKKSQSSIIAAWFILRPHGLNRAQAGDFYQRV